MSTTITGTVTAVREHVNRLGDRWAEVELDSDAGYTALVLAFPKVHRRAGALAVGAEVEITGRWHRGRQLFAHQIVARR